MSRQKNIIFYYLMTAVSVLFLLSVLVLRYTTWFHSSGYVHLGLGPRKDKEEIEKRSYICKELFYKYPNDLEIQLGLAYLNSRYTLLEDLSDKELYFRIYGYLGDVYIQFK